MLCGEHVRVFKFDEKSDPLGSINIKCIKRRRNLSLRAISEEHKVDLGRLAHSHLGVCPQRDPTALNNRLLHGLYRHLCQLTTSQFIGCVLIALTFNVLLFQGIYQVILRTTIWGLRKQYHFSLLNGSGVSSSSFLFSLARKANIAAPSSGVCLSSPSGISGH